jgi:2-keto-3-deoxy-L-rhamnonate aldolase RhmA
MRIGSAYRVTEKPAEGKAPQGKTRNRDLDYDCGLENAEIMARAGLDFLMIDCEHGCMDVETAGRMVSLIRPTQTAPLIRVEWNHISTVKRGLDTGAYGIMIPFVNTKEEAEQAVSYCKYPVRGLRGNGLSRATTFGVDMEYMSVADREVLVILQIEHYKAVENIDEILSVPDIDIAFIGPADMSTSMGIAGQLDHPDVVANCRKVEEACRRHHVIPGILCGTPAPSAQSGSGLPIPAERDGQHDAVRRVQAAAGRVPNRHEVTGRKEGNTTMYFATPGKQKHGGGSRDRASNRKARNISSLLIATTTGATRIICTIRKT